MLAKRNMLQSPYFLIVGDRLYLPEVDYKNTKIHKKSQIISFLWPLKGKIISNFGSKQGGTFNEGINISAPLGTRVSASADGIALLLAAIVKQQLHSTAKMVWSGVGEAGVQHRPARHDQLHEVVRQRVGLAVVNLEG